MNYAFIPARGGSESVPRKNLVDIAGQPLIYWTVKAARDSKVFDAICLSSDDEDIRNTYGQICRDLNIPGSQWWVSDRPEPLARSKARSEDALMDWLWHRPMTSGRQVADCDEDIIVTLQPTSPLRRADDIHRVVALIEEERADSVVSGCELEHPSEWSAPVERIGDDYVWKWQVVPSVQHFQRQQCEKLYRLNGAIFAARARFLYRYRWYHGEAKPSPAMRRYEWDAVHSVVYNQDPQLERERIYIMEKRDSLDIDDWTDVRIADALMRYRLQAKTEREPVVRDSTPDSPVENRKVNDGIVGIE